LEKGEFYARFKNEYRTNETDRYLEEQLSKILYSKEKTAQVIMSKRYNYYMQEYMHKGITEKSLKNQIDTKLQHSYEFTDDFLYYRDINLVALGEKLARKNVPAEQYELFSTEARKGLILWLFE
jgi:hypothetical protein